MNIKEPGFSICIPNYNYGRYIGETIQSVLDQTYQNFEIVVADNASTDNSVKVVQSFNDSRIRLIRNRYNIGFAPNLQRATMYARNDFINLLSSDDLMRPTALENYASVLQKQGGHGHRILLMSDVYHVDGESRIVSIVRKAKGSFARVRTPLSPGFQPLDDAPTVYTCHRGLDVLRDRLRCMDTVGAFCSIVYPRKLWEAIEGYNSVRTIGPDKHFNYKLLWLDPIVAYVHKPLFSYRDYVSDNRAGVKITIRHPIDDYLNTLEFGRSEFLQPLGLSRRDLIRAMLEQRCLREALASLGQGHYRQAFQLFAFALAAYPGEALRIPKTYVLMALLASGPLARFAAPPLRWFYRRFLLPRHDPHLRGPSEVTETR